jgi:F-type H+-transporting ATPase subunit a
MSKYLFLLSIFLLSKDAFAAGVLVEFVDFYHGLLHWLHIDGEAAKHWVAVPGAVMTLVVITVLGTGFRKHVERELVSPVPRKGFSIFSIVEVVIEFVGNFAKDIIGEDKYQKFMPLLCGLFVFILISNLSGLVPGFHPPTLSIDTNLAMGLTVFIYYNYAGFKEHGAHYLQQFMGPVAWMLPLMLIIEIVAHLARPMSLSLRLYGNIFGDHLVLSVFTGLTWLVMPAAFMFFGLLVALIQSFVFTLLSSIYISLAISHDH